MGHYQDVLKANRGPSKELSELIPETYAGFRTMHHEAFGDGALDGGVKELIALGIAIVEGCDGCIASHARAAVIKGVTRQQFAEMISVSIAMQGGPATIYGPRAWEAYKEFSERLSPEG